MDQLGLSFDAAPARSRARTQPDETLEERFEAFHEANPDVYAELLALALAGKRRGLKRLGIGSLFEVIRWNRALATIGEPWKLNNSYRAYYSRLLMANEPELTGIFETRTAQADEGGAEG